MKIFLKYIYMFFKKIYLKFSNCYFEEKTRFNHSCKFEGYNLVGYGSYLSKVYLGFASYTSYFCFLRNTYIGKYTCIGPNVKIAIGRHPTSKFVSIHPAFYSINHVLRLSYVKHQKFDEVKEAENTHNKKCHYSVWVGNDVWIGANVTIMDGVTIGDGAIIGAGSIVTKNVEPYSIMVGIPAKLLRKRFEDDIIDKLLELRWWDKNEKWINEYAEYFEDIDLFMYNLNN